MGLIEAGRVVGRMMLQGEPAVGSGQLGIPQGTGRRMGGKRSDLVVPCSAGLIEACRVVTRLTVLF